MSTYFLELRTIRKGVAIRTVLISLIIVMLLAFFPSMQNESMQALTGAKLEGIDPAILSAFGLSEMVDFTIITNYYGYALQFITLAIMVLVAQQAALLLIKEETDGTIEYLYAKPVSRTMLFFQKLLAQLTGLVCMMLVFVAVSVVGYLLVSSYSFEEAACEALILFSGIFFVSLMYIAVGLLFSVVLKSSKGVMGVTIALIFGTYLLGVFSSLIPDLDFLIWASPIDWIKASKLLGEGILWQEWTVGISVIGLGTAAAWLRYRTKDLLV